MSILARRALEWLSDDLDVPPSAILLGLPLGVFAFGVAVAFVIAMLGVTP